MKKAARRPLLKNDFGNKSGLQTLLRKAGAGGRALAGLELRVRFADHVNRALAFHDLAICVAAFCGSEGRENFHGVRLLKWTDGTNRRGAEISQRPCLVKPFLARRTQKQGNFANFILGLRNFIF